MAKLIGFKNITLKNKKDLKLGQVLERNPEWKEGSKKPKYVKVPGAYVRDGELFQVAQFKCDDGSYMVPQYKDE